MRRTVGSAALGLAFVAGAWPGASMGGPAADAPPRLHSFSPAAARPGDVFLIDAEFADSRRPRVWIGARPLPRRSVRVARETDGSPVRRIWARIPAHMPAGDHVLKIATRSGKAVAAKPIKVASCYAEVQQPADCDDVPNSGAELTFTGAGGYRSGLEQSSSLRPEVLFGQSNLDLFIDVDLDFNMTILLAPADIHVGDAPVLQMVYTTGAGRYWQRFGGTVRVVEESATRVALCVDAVLVNEFPQFLRPGEPVEVTVKGYMVVTR